MMANIGSMPYEQGLIKLDYIINLEIEAYDLAGSPINLILLSNTLKSGSWAVLHVVPILLIYICIILFFQLS